MSFQSSKRPRTRFIQVSNGVPMANVQDVGRPDQEIVAAAYEPTLGCPTRRHGFDGSEGSDSRDNFTVRGPRYRFRKSSEVIVLDDDVCSSVQIENKAFKAGSSSFAIFDDDPPEGDRGTPANTCIAREILQELKPSIDNDVAADGIQVLSDDLGRTPGIPVGSSASNSLGHVHVESQTPAGQSFPSSSAGIPEIEISSGESSGPDNDLPCHPRHNSVTSSSLGHRAQRTSILAQVQSSINRKQEYSLIGDEYLCQNAETSDMEISNEHEVEQQVKSLAHGTVEDVSLPVSSGPAQEVENEARPLMSSKSNIDAAELSKEPIMPEQTIASSCSNVKDSNESSLSCEKLQMDPDDCLKAAVYTVARDVAGAKGSDKGCFEVVKKLGRTFQLVNQVSKAANATLAEQTERSAESATVPEDGEAAHTNAVETVIGERAGISENVNSHTASASVGRSTSAHQAAQGDEGISDVVGPLEAGLHGAASARNNPQVASTTHAETLSSTSKASGDNFSATLNVASGIEERCARNEKCAALQFKSDPATESSEAFKDDILNVVNAEAPNPQLDAHAPTPVTSAGLQVTEADPTPLVDHRDTTGNGAERIESNAPASQSPQKAIVTLKSLTGCDESRANGTPDRASENPAAAEELDFDSSNDLRKEPGLAERPVGQITNAPSLLNVAQANLDDIAHEPSVPKLTREIVQTASDVKVSDNRHEIVALPNFGDRNSNQESGTVERSNSSASIVESGDSAHPKTTTDNDADSMKPSSQPGPDNHGHQLSGVSGVASDVGCQEISANAVDDQRRNYGVHANKCHGRGAYVQFEGRPSASSENALKWEWNAETPFTSITDECSDDEAPYGVRCNRRRWSNFEQHAQMIAAEKAQEDKYVLLLSSLAIEPTSYIKPDHSESEEPEPVKKLYNSESKTYVEFPEPAYPSRKRLEMISRFRAKHSREPFLSEPSRNTTETSPSMAAEHALLDFVSPKPSVVSLNRLAAIRRFHQKHVAVSQKKGAGRNLNQNSPDVWSMEKRRVNCPCESCSRTSNPASADGTLKALDVRGRTLDQDA